MLLVRCPPGCEYASAYSFDRPHSFSTCSSSHADIRCRRAHSRSRRSRCAKLRRDGAWYASQTFLDSSANDSLSLPRLRMFSQPCRKQRSSTTSGNSASHAWCVEAQPSTLTVRGR